MPAKPFKIIFHLSFLRPRQEPEVCMIRNGGHTTRPIALRSVRCDFVDNHKKERPCFPKLDLSIVY